MKTRFAAGSTALLLVNLTLGGCITAPSAFYTLNSTLPTDEELAPPLPTQELAVGPSGLDRCAFRYFSIGPRLWSVPLTTSSRWTSSIAGAALWKTTSSGCWARNLSWLLGAKRILVEPAEVRFPLDFQVVADVLKFKGALGGNAIFKVRWGGAGRGYAGDLFGAEGHGRRFERDPIRLQS